MLGEPIGQIDQGACAPTIAELGSAKLFASERSPIMTGRCRHEKHPCSGKVPQQTFPSLYKDQGHLRLNLRREFGNEGNSAVRNGVFLARRRGVSEQSIRPHPPTG